jgi:release factor glutamine methyltransferase
LFVPNEEPLIFYKAIAAFCEQHLQTNGMVFLETHVDYAKAVQQIFSVLNYEVKIKIDLFGRERFVMATRCH